jgi:dTDP-glucose 4,6-dehydratase
MDTTGARARRTTDPSGRRVLISGAAGMVGSHVAALLLDRGDHVVGVDDLSTGDPCNLHRLRSSPRFELVVADVADGVEVDGPLDAVLHLASPASPRHFRTMPIEILRANSIGTLHLLELADARAATFLFASSSEVYGDPEVHPQAEDYTGNVRLGGERSCYDEGKRFGEAAVEAFRTARGTSTRIARIFNTYGPGMRPDDGRVVANLVVQALRGEPLTVYGDGTQTRSFCFVDDLARGIVRLLDADVRVPVNLGSEVEVEVLELAKLVSDLVGATAGIEHRPLPEHDPVRRRPDVRRAQELLGWAAEVDLEEGLTRTIDHFRSL